MAGTPATFDIDVIRGDTFDSVYFQIVTSDTLNPSSYPTTIIFEPTIINGTTFTPLDLTGATILSDIRKSTAYTAERVVQFTVAVPDPVNGIYTMSLTAEQTTLLAMNDSVSYRYDTQVTDSNGKTHTYVMGAVNVTLDVTRNTL